MSDNVYSVSEALSEVMGDIGLNATCVMQRREAMLLKEKMHTITQGLFSNVKVYIFGSQIEGSTTIDLQSDYDKMIRKNLVNVIQDMSEWKLGVVNYMMIQNDNISPGYCYLQCIRHDQPSPEIVNTSVSTGVNRVIDSEGRVLLDNDYSISGMEYYYGTPILQRHGPAFTKRQSPGSSAVDVVLAHYCSSLPRQAISRLHTLRCRRWPSEDFHTYCRNDGCFVVPVSSKDSDLQELEWRISTSLQERYLMLSLNITQLRCYVLMKLILKTHINLHLEDILTSFMCKNVLLYCVSNSSHAWHSGTLLSYLHLCLFMLKECVQKRNCPHFMIPENNLLAGRMTEVQRGKLLDRFDNLMEDGAQALHQIQIADLGRRLKMKLNMIPYSPELPSSTDIALRIVAQLIHQNASHTSSVLNMISALIDRDNLEEKQSLSKILSKLTDCRENGSSVQQTAGELFIPLVSSSLGSVIASKNIDTNTAVSDEALDYLEAGKESDVLSGRLKLVSVLYCTGDIERAEGEMESCQQLYNRSVVEPVCHCYEESKETFKMKEGFINACEDSIKESIKSLVAFCVRFLKTEMNCVPRELRFEILKSYLEKDRHMRTDEDSSWMNLIVVDSITYLYFLQYWTYGHLQRRQEQDEALYNLVCSIRSEFNLSHKETALNLLGQCLEQENRDTEALQCYIRSLKHCKRNNAARFLLCIQLSKHLKPTMETNLHI